MPETLLELQSFACVLLDSGGVRIVILYTNLYNTSPHVPKIFVVSSFVLASQISALQTYDLLESVKLQRLAVYEQLYC